MDEGIITGYDGRFCMCCGGLMISFNGSLWPYSGDFKLIENSYETGISPNETFPIHVTVNWEPVTDKCSGNYIKVLKLVRK